MKAVKNILVASYWDGLDKYKYIKPVVPNWSSVLSITFEYEQVVHIHKNKKIRTIFKQWMQKEFHF